MDTFTILAGLILVVLVGGFAIILNLLRKNTEKPEDGTGMVLLQQQLQKLSEVVDSKLGEGNKQVVDSLRAQFTQSQQLVKNIEERVSSQLLEVAKGVSRNEESTRQVVTIAEQLRNLEKVLKNQKQRGNLGEASLELILSNVLPGQYVSQYMFKNGDKVDFVITTRDGIVPVDAKFPLDNYIRLIDEVDEQRRDQYRKAFKLDVKTQVDQTSKYIRPEEGTIPFALMFIPAEGLFSDLLNNEVGVGVNAQDLFEYARKKNVFITSPTTFLVYLQTILFGNQRAKIQETAKDIIKNVAELGKHLKAYEAHHNSLGKSLSAAVGHFESSGKSFKAIDKDVVRIAGESIELKLEEVDRPLLPEG